MELTKLLAVAALTPLAMAQSNVTDYVWSAAVVTMFGERIPLLAVNYSTLTATGASQMNAAGALFRDRYLAPQNVSQNGNMSIVGINPDLFDGWQTQILAMSDVYVQQSAQAFLDGLYPPTTKANHSSGGEGNNGGPLGGLQYPQFYMAGPYDPSYLYLNGSEQCAAFDESVSNYLASQSFQDEAHASSDFYAGLNDQFASSLGVIPGSPHWFGNAYQVWDLLQFEANVSDSSGDASASQVQQARYLADAYTTAIYGNASADGGIRVIGGATLAAAVSNALYNAANTNATAYKLNLYFPAPEAVISLLALLGEAQTSDQLSGMPDVGSSLSFELYSPADKTTVNKTSGMLEFPSVDNLFVRLVLRNGTNSTNNVDQIELFGHGNAGTVDISFTDFLNSMSVISLSDVATWCETCSSSAVWCPYYTDGQVGLSFSSSVGKPIIITTDIAGAIGASVTLVTIAFILLLAMFVFGVRFTRREGKGLIAAGRKDSSSRRKSDLGGFKGGRKLASDVDLPAGAAPDGKPVFGATVVSSPDGESAHRRVESWELREGRRRQSVDSHRDGGLTKEHEAV